MTSPRWDWRLDQIAWLDVETDGLPQAGSLPLLLEVALVLTDATLTELGRYSAVIYHPTSVLAKLTPSQAVLDMHSQNGLWNDLVGQKTATVRVAEAAMIKILDDHPSKSPVIWGGFSPGRLDRPVIEANMPDFYRRIHHRTLDLSAVKLVMLNWAGVELDKRGATHRALADCLDSIMVAKIYQRLLKAVGQRRSLVPLTSLAPLAPIAS